jgi:hypothetical protein
MLSRILIGILMSAVGYLMVWKTEWFMEMIGRIDWAERHLGGGSRFFYKLIGIAIILIGFLAITNLYDEVIGGFFRSIF